MNTTFSTAISEISAGNSLSESQSFDCFSQLLDGQIETKEIEVLLRALIAKQESVSELTGFTRAMRSKMNKLQLSQDAIDVCGTGGTGKDRFNVSTVTAFTLASMGVPVAKHGNRGSKKANGSFDFLEHLNILFDGDKDYTQQLFNQTNLCFLFAKNYHAAVRFAVPARQAIGQRTVFNVLGPLSNPAEVPYQIIGTLTIDLAEKLASVIQNLPVKRALVIVGGDGFDELSITKPSHVYDVSSERIQKFTFDPAQLHLPDLGELNFGSDAQENAEIFNTVFTGGNQEHPLIHLVAANAGAGLYCMKRVDDICSGYKKALMCIRSGKMYAHFEHYRDLSQKSLNI